MKSTLEDFTNKVELGKVTCDTRDPTVIQTNLRKMNVPVIRKGLPFGDYASITPRAELWVLERKKTEDFLSALTNSDGSNRLYDQARRLLEHSVIKHVFWLPEGLFLPDGQGNVRLERGSSSWPYMAVYHAHIELAALGINILPPVAEGYSHWAIKQVFETMNAGIPKYITPRIRRPVVLHSPYNTPAQRYIGPLIGNERMTALGSKYGTLATLFAEVIDNPKVVAKTKGVGKMTVDKLRDLLTFEINAR